MGLRSSTRDGESPSVPCVCYAPTILPVIPVPYANAWHLTGPSVFEGNKPHIPIPLPLPELGSRCTTYPTSAWGTCFVRRGGPAAQRPLYVWYGAAGGE